MTERNDNEAAKLADHMAKLQAAGAVQMTPEEILAGQSQAGVPRPAFLKDDEDDGSVHKVPIGRGTP